MNIIAIDCGASFIKACLFDEMGNVKKEFVSAAPKPMEKAEDIFTFKQIPALTEIIETAIDSFVPECNGTIGISISNEMHGFLLCKENGKLFCDYISWQKEFGNLDTSLGRPVNALYNECKDEIKKTGMPLRAGLPSANLLYLKFTGKLDNSGLLEFYTLGDYILHHLSGGSVICHPSNAAGTGLYDLLTGDWNWKLTDYVSGDNVKFPTVGDEIIYFEYKGRKFVAVPAIGDYQAAMLGAGIADERTLSFNLATGAQVSCLVKDFSAEKLKDLDAQVVPYFDGRYLKRIAFIPSGRAVNVYIRFIKDVCNAFDVEISDDKIWGYITSSLSSDKDGDMSFALSFFENSVSDSTNGAIENIGENALTFENFITSMFSSLVDGYLKCADRIFSDRDEVTKILMTGGLVRRVEYIQKKIKNHYSQDTICKVVANETLNGNRIHLMKIMDGECEIQKD